MFRGKRHGGVTIKEFLKNMTMLQNNYKLSRQEFKMQMLRATSGIAHDFLAPYVDEETTTVKQIYTFMIARFDNSPTPEEAKKRLYALKATKEDNLMKLIGTILELTNQAALAVPKSFRALFFDSEASESLIRCFPFRSSNFAQEKFIDLRASTGNVPNFHEFTDILSRHSEMINKDIFTNGAIKARMYRVTKEEEDGSTDENEITSSDLDEEVSQDEWEE